MQKDRAVFISWLSTQEKTRMMLIIVLGLLASCLGDNVHPQDSKQCVMDRDVHELLVKMNCELVRTKERLKAFEGRVDYS